MPETAFTKLSFREAIAFFLKKLAMTEEEFLRLSEAEKLRAFTVSGLAEESVLNEIKDEIARALREGTTLREFQTAFEEILTRRGWAGPDPWRVNTIFQTNVQTAYEVGRYKQLTDPAVLGARPYWQYVAVMDSRTRPTHAALNGKVFPADHPFWNTWYPPNGFNCRCTIRSLSARELAREGLAVESTDPTGRLIEPTDPVTGARLPAVALLPDVGWAQNAGKLAA